MFCVTWSATKKFEPPRLCDVAEQEVGDAVVGESGVEIVRDRPVLQVHPLIVLVAIVHAELPRLRAARDRRGVGDLERVRIAVLGPEVADA